MKHFLFGITLATLLAGCTSPSGKDQPPTYTIEAVMIEAPTGFATNGFPQPIFGLDAAHIISSPEMEKLPPLYVSVSDLNEGGPSGRIGDMEGRMKRFADAREMSAYMEVLLQHPEAMVTRFPEGNVSIGEQYVDDAIELLELPDDYDVVDGKAVASHMGTYKTGQSINLRLLEVEDAMISYELKMYIGRLKGFETYTLSTGDEIKIPYMEARSVDTHLTQPLGTWISPGGLTCELMNGDNTTSKTILFGLRITESD